MIYEYTCCDEIFERILPLSRYNEPQNCPKCGQVARKIISNGATHGEEAPWIESTNVGLTSPHEEPVKTRSEYYQRLKEKNLEPMG